ncbi:CPBP family intramembrane metalloprotease [Methylobacterium sp. BTF04]|nr:CPBP family intramembrane glutamic endopeptidase [Methylobacterium sp. BTF04]NEU11711.1 CPBP family intramembrane metalloprotease [Methylobacterium sp. BTF04]
MLYLVAASLVALLIVRVGSDWIDGTNPLAGAAERPRLYPQQIAMRELALDVLRQICLAGLVMGIGRWRIGPGWRGTLALGWRPGESWRLAPVTFGAILLVWPVLHIVWVTGTAEFFHAPFGRHVGLSPFLSTTATVVWLAYVAILAPIAEELLMRGAIFAKGLAPLGPAGIIVTSAILFSGAHVTPAGFARPVSLVPLALVLGWLRWRSGRLWPCILLHGWSNLAMVAYVLWPTDI